MFSTLTSDLREMAREQVQYRELLLLQMTLRDLRLRYKQTIMGFGWAIFMPRVKYGGVLHHFHACRAARHRDAVPALCLLRPAGVELLGGLVPFPRDVVDRQQQSRHEGLFST